MSVMMICEYNGKEVVDIDFTIESCKEYVVKVNEKNSDWIEKEIDRFGDWEGKNDEDDEECFGVCVMIKCEKENDKLILIKYCMFCIEDGWIDVCVNFVKVD